MAKVKRSALAYDSTVWANWFNSLDCSLISLDGTNIIIDNIFMIKLERLDYWPSVALYKDGTMITSRTVTGLSTITVAYSDTLFYIYTRDQNGSTGVGIFLTYEKTSDFQIYAYGDITGHPNFQDYTFTDIITGNQYAHSGVLKYTTDLNYIDYTEDRLFSSGQREFVDNNFLSCSTITPDSVITFAGKNHYSVGPNILVSIDED